ncbi:hypothetical protein C8J56DRAFT_1064013 [Mycena floridula]|nr:hypothetical protein C8J56DRAFT_1064013 [Mycena floridula]
MSAMPAMPTAQQILADPSLLLHGRQESHIPLTGVDGKVGALVSVNGEDYIITSPNADRIYTPPLGECSISLKVNHHFGVHDPMVYPQPFVPEVGYLAAMAEYQHSPHSPLYLKPTEVPFYIPTDDDFILKDPSSSWNKLGTLRTVVREAITNVVRMSTYDLKTSIHSAIRDDERIIQYDLTMQSLCQRLLRPAPKKEAFALLANLNRVYLESQARKLWVSVIKPRLESSNNKVHPPEPVIGAFTDDFDIANHLFRAGIPVWYIHKLSDLPRIRIQQHQQPEIFTSNAIGVSSDSLEVKLVEADPPHPIIFTGFAVDPRRYKEMSTYLRSTISTGILRQPQRDASLGPLRSAALPDGQGKGAKAKDRYRKHDEKRHLPSRSAQDEKRHQPNVLRSKYEDIPNPMMPPPIPAWSDALRALSKLQESHREGFNPGYALPEPGMILGAGNEETRARYLTAYVKMRDALLYRCNAGRSNLHPLSSRQWRSILSIEMGQEPRSETAMGKKRVEAIGLLSQAIGNTFPFTREYLGTLSPVWEEVVLSPLKLPAAQTVREILFELNEANFRIEFHSVDAMLSSPNRPGHTAEDRHLLIAGTCWPNHSMLPDLATAECGLNAPSLIDRGPYLKAVHDIMKGWMGKKPFSLHTSFPQFEDGSVEALKRLTDVETDMASFYTTSFERQSLNDIS